MLCPNGNSNRITGFLFPQPETTDTAIQVADSCKWCKFPCALKYSLTESTTV